MKKPLKNLRCAECGGLTETLLAGRCPVCVRRIEAQSGDWRITQLLVRAFRRHDGQHLRLVLRRDDVPGWSSTIAAPRGQALPWVLDATERDDNGRHEARIGEFTELIAAIAAGEQFGRRWIEMTPGTSIATYVPRPTT